jgi:hypothetical protein
MRPRKIKLSNAEAVKQLRKIGARIKSLETFSDDELLAELLLRLRLAGKLPA